MKSQNHTFVGVMTGTSVDGLDIAAIDIDLAEKIEFIASETVAYPPDLRENLLALSQAEAANISSYGELDAMLGRFIGNSVNGFRGNSVSIQKKFKLLVVTDKPSDINRQTLMATVSNRLLCK